MADKNVTINVGATNSSGKTFQQIRLDLGKLKADIEKPIEGPAIRPRFDDAQQTARDRLAGLTRGLQKAGDSAEQKNAIGKFLPGAELTQNDLIREQNARFLGTASGGSSGAIGGLPSEGRIAGIRDRYGELVGKLVALHGIMHVAEAGFEGLDAVMADSAGHTKQAAEGYIAFSEALGRVPIVGQFALTVANRITGGALEGAKKALADAEEIDKQTSELGAKLRERRAHGEEIVAGTRAGARSASDALQLAGTAGDDRARLDARIKFNDKIAELDEQEKQKFSKDVGPDQRLEIEKNVGVQRLAAQQELVDKLQEIDAGGMRKQLDLLLDNSERIKDINRLAVAEDLDLQGKHHEARLETIKANYEKEREALHDALDNAQQGLKPEDPRYQLAQGSYDDANAAAQAARDRKLAAENQNDQTEHEQSIRDSGDRIATIQEHASEQRLKIAGDFAGAERAQRDSEAQNALQQINRRYDDEIKLHGERSDELNQKRAEELGAQQKLNDANAEDANKSESEKYRIKGPAPFQGESRLLTGVGSTADSAIQNPQVELAKKAEKDREKQVDFLKSIDKGIANLLGALGGGTPVAEAV